MPLRDLRPLAIAGATAVGSCGLLALAIWLDWLGADVGRGANFCEAARDSAIRQPANTMSNAGFVLAGLLIAWHARRRDNIGTSLSSRPGMATAFACLVVLLGPASAAMHATQSASGGQLDLLSMYLVASFAASYAAMRWLRGGSVQFAALFITGVVFCETIGQLSTNVPVVGYSGNAAFGLLLIVAVGLEVRILRRGEARARRGHGLIALAAIVVAFVIWNASKTWLCDPDSLIQGHAIWHALGAVSAYFLFHYYASEDVVEKRAPAMPVTGAS